jgi:hypothetical protein
MEFEVPHFHHPHSWTGRNPIVGQLVVIEHFMPTMAEWAVLMGELDSVRDYLFRTTTD